MARRAADVRAGSAPNRGVDVAPLQRRLTDGLPEQTPVVRHLPDADEAGWVIGKVVATQYRIDKDNAKEWVAKDHIGWSATAHQVAGRAEFLAQSERPSELEQWAIYQYAGNCHAWINPLLGGRDTEQHRAMRDAYFARDETKVATFDELVALIRSGLEKLPAPAESIVRVSKGVDLEPKIKQQVVNDAIVSETTAPRYTVDEHAVGKTYTVTELNSTSTGNPFLDRDSLIVYRLKSGHLGRVLPQGFSPSSNEQEVLFPPGMTYRVVAVTSHTDADFNDKLAEVGATGHAPNLHRIVEVELV